MSPTIPDDPLRLCEGQESFAFSCRTFAVRVSSLTLLREETTAARVGQGIPGRLLADLEVVAMVMMMVMAVMNYHDNLRLRRIGYCEAEGEHEPEQNLFHNSVCRWANSITELQ